MIKGNDGNEGRNVTKRIRAKLPRSCDSPWSWYPGWYEFGNGWRHLHPSSGTSQQTSLCTWTWSTEQKQTNPVQSPNYYNDIQESFQQSGERTWSDVPSWLQRPPSWMAKRNHEVLTPRLAPLDAESGAHWAQRQAPWLSHFCHAASCWQGVSKKKLEIGNNFNQYVFSIQVTFWYPFAIPSLLFLRQSVVWLWV